METVPRRVTAADGSEWEAVAVAETVAHLRAGARLCFRPADGDQNAEPIPTTVTFNSPEAAAASLGSMGDAELRRRLELALVAKG
ncbi:MAG: hypothetical protein ACREKN_06555 [Longimicrobiaceae bacterium]